MTRALAHALSILGHPALLMPLIVLLAAGTNGLAPVLAAGAVAAIVMIYSAARVRSGKWRDSDASAQHERLELNLVLSALLVGAASLGYWLGQPLKLVLGLALAAAIILVALALRERLKLSLHVAFAAFGAGAITPLAPFLGAALAAFAIAIAWARTTLHRHNLVDVVAGASAGALAALILAIV